MHEIYRYAFVTDKTEGLIVVNVDTLADRDPKNNFLRRAVTFNPNGQLNGAVNLTIAGTYAYVLCARGLVVVDLDDPLQPAIVVRSRRTGPAQSARRDGDLPLCLYCR